ncbi:MAG: phage tail protein [Pseudomonadota bacterium]
MMRQAYPPVAFSFAVWIAGAPAVDAGFSEVSGLTTEWEVAEIREGGVPTPHQVPSRAKVGPLVLSRGIMLASSPLFDWCTEVMESVLVKPIAPRDIAVALLGPMGEPVIAWNVVRAWPIRWTIEPFKADTSEVAMEKIEFACHAVMRARQADLPGLGLNRNAG